MNDRDQHSRAPGRGEISRGFGLERRFDPDRFGAYRVREKLASGGMAEIFRVQREEAPDQSFALKTIRPDCDEDPQFRRMLIDEAKIASLLVHPNIARVLGIVEDGGQLGLIMEFVDGLDVGRLRKHLKDDGDHLSLGLAVHVVREVLAGLEFAHQVRDERGELLDVVHRDISPGNVMIDVRGEVRIVDFGIARAQNRLAKTEAGNIKGKFRYMAPEQIRGDRVGPATDVYATAIFFWELLAGRRVYDDVGVPQLMIRVANAHVPPLEEARPGLPRSLERVFQRATQQRPSERFGSARAFSEALQAALPEVDPEACREALGRIVRGAQGRDTRARFDRAVARARFAAAQGDLEGAILSALESPDRVERVDVYSAEVAEPLTAVHPLPVLDSGSEPPTMPMARPVDASGEKPAPLR